MTIEELQKAFSKDQRGKDITPEVAILHSKVTMYLSNEIAYLKQALCEQAKNLQASNERLSNANERLAKINLWLTAIIAISTLAGVVIAVLK
jgi:hypothetical protein